MGSSAIRRTLGEGLVEQTHSAASWLDYLINLTQQCLCVCVCVLGRCSWLFWFYSVLSNWMTLNYHSTKTTSTWSVTSGSFLASLFLWGILSVHDMRFGVFFFIVLPFVAVKGLHKKLPMWWPESAKLWRIEKIGICRLVCKNCNCWHWSVQ